MPTRVLLVDDDVRLVEMLSEYLRSRGFEVDARGDGESGLSQQARADYDAVILDVMLPGIDGLEVCRRMRARSQVPILMLTARGDDMDRIIGLEIGADDYLPTPFNPRELLARLAAILRRSRGAAGRDDEVLRFGPLEIDRSAREVRVAGQRRELTGRQFDLLLLLAEEADPIRRGNLARRSGEDIAELDALVEELLSAARTQPGVPRRPFAETDLFALVRDEAEAVSAQVTGEPLPLPCEPTMITRMVRNLLANARLHGHGTAIRAEVRREGGEILVAVEDNGPGVPESERERIFAPFYRASSDLRCNPHFHCLFLDGVYAPDADGKGLMFHPAPGRGPMARRRWTSRPWPSSPGGRPWLSCSRGDRRIGCRRVAHETHPRHWLCSQRLHSDRVLGPRVPPYRLVRVQQ